jgi:hypothetical protein
MIREKLCIPADADPGRAAAQIEASVHAKDYHIDNDAIRNLRTASVDVLWRRAARDVDSVKHAVRLATCQRPALSHHAQHMCSNSEILQLLTALHCATPLLCSCTLIHTATGAN